MIHDKRSGSRPRGNGPHHGMRLRDLIPALKTRQASAIALLERIDPGIIDELSAFAVHRRLDLMDIAADCLEQLAFDAADAIWQLGIERHSGQGEDPEAALLGSILRKVMFARLHHEHVIGSQVTIRTVHIGFSRSGHPYTMA